MYIEAEKNQLDLQRISTCQKKSQIHNKWSDVRVMDDSRDQLFRKGEAYDHRNATKLVMSLQSSEIELVRAILLRVLTLKKVNFNANRVTGDPENISRTAKEISILPLAYCYRS